MDFSYSHIKVMIPPSNRLGGTSVTDDVCEAIFKMKGTSYPTPTFVSEIEGVQILFMATDKEETFLMLRSIGQKPIVLSTVKMSATDRQRDCPNCGWIVSNPECMRCKW